MRAVIAREIARLLTSRRLLETRRNLAAVKRRLTGGPAVVHYFHQADDPYSHLVLQVLPAFVRRYDVQLRMHLVPAPSDAAAPDRARLEAWSRRDAASLAAAVGLEFADPGNEQDLALTGAASDSERAAMLEAGAALRSKLGHYLGAMLHFEGEWYWGVDRLWYLERRLQAAGLARDVDERLIVDLPRVECRHRPTNGHRPELDFFCSLRSPYTYLAVERVLRLAECYGARLRLRFVLPMVMRGLPVPRDKRLYILSDAKREAETLGLPFGRIVDPVGSPAERGLAVLHRAAAAGKGPEFLGSFMRGVWADGLDAGSDAGLRRIAARAGLDEAFVDAALADPSWREAAQANREDMLALGLWGVPSFRVDAGPARWGQDRLWQVERDLIEATAAAAMN